jgi:hypothetical protein
LMIVIQFKQNLVFSPMCCQCQNHHSFKFNHHLRNLIIEKLVLASA